MSLPILVAQDKWQDFDEAWTEQMSQDGPIDDLLTAIRLAGDKKRISRCVPLVRQHVELLEASERHADAARLLGAALAAGAPASEVASPLMEHAEKAWGNEPWWEKHVEITGLSSGNDLRRPWKAFNKLRDFREGTLIYHAGGWGTGEITELREADSEINVRFESGRSDHFPMSGAVDIFEPLAEEDLRAQHFRDPEGLKKRLKKEHLEILKAVVSRYYGRATLASIKNALAQVSIEGSAWSAWWRKAKKLAENSEWFRISGSGQRMEVRLLLTAADPVEQLERQLRILGSLAEVTARTKDLSSDKSTSPELLEIALARLEEESADETHPISERLGAWMLLRELRGETPPALTEWLIAAKDAPKPDDITTAPELWKLFQAMPASREQEACIDLLQELYGDDWADEALANLAFAPPGMIRVLIEKLRTAKRQKELAEIYATLISRPMRAPYTLIALRAPRRDRQARGRLPRARDARASAADARRAPLGDPPRRRAVDPRAHAPRRHARRRSRGRPLEPARGRRRRDDALDATDHATRRRGVDRQPGHRDRVPRRPRQRRGDRARRLLGRRRDLDDAHGPREAPRRAGRARQRQDARERRGDRPRRRPGRPLGEREWEAAIEEKRNLSDRAATMKEELRHAALLENAILPEDTVCPGTRIRYNDITAGKERSIAFLGPWDTQEDPPIVSYRAPLAQGMLGLHIGDKKTVSLPGGDIDIEILSIEPIDVD